MKPRSLYAVIIAHDVIDKLAEVNKLLAEGADPNETGGDSHNTSLHEAAGNSYTAEILASLLKAKKKANPNATNKLGRTPLHHAACYYNNSAAIAMLIDNGADVNARDADKCTPLYRAVVLNCADAVITLINRGATVDAVDNEGNSPLHEAAWGNYEDIIETLIKNGADRNKQNGAGQTPLHRSVHLHRLYNGEAEAVKFLIEKYQVDLNTKDKLGNSPLHEAVIRKNNNEIITALITAGANINEKNIHGKTSLDVAAENGCLETAKILLAKLYQQDSTSPIYLAMKKIYDDAIPLWKMGSTEDRRALTESLLLANKVVTSTPADKTKAAEDLNTNALTLAQGKPSTWKKFIGALTALAGVVVLALSIAGVLFSGGASLIGMYVAGGLLAAGGLTLFGSSLQRGFSKDLSALSHVATYQPTI